MRQVDPSSPLLSLHKKKVGALEGGVLKEWGPEGVGTRRGGAQTQKKLGPKEWWCEGWGGQRVGARGVGGRWGVEGWGQNFAFVFSSPDPLFVFSSNS